MRYLFHDFETRSVLNLPDVGASRYTRHQSTQVLMCAYALDNGPERQWVPAEGERMPDDLHDAVRDPECRKVAFNVGFEKLVWRHCLGEVIPPGQWTDVMIMARYISIASNLDEVGQILRLPQDRRKIKARQLMGFFSMPNDDGEFNSFADNREWWQAYLLYNRQDLTALRAIFKRLKRHMYPQREHTVWVADQRINARGMPVNRRMLDKVIWLRDRLVAERTERVTRITGGIKPTQVAKIRDWCRERGYPFHDLQKGHIAAALDSPSGRLTDECREVLKCRREVGMASLKKFDSLRERVDVDGYLRGCFEMMGAARTGRWSSRGYQAHNMIKAARGVDGLEKKKFGPRMVRITGGMQLELARLLEHDPLRVEQRFRKNVFDVMAGAVRTTVQAPRGYLLAVADYSAVENVVLGWLSGDEKILRVFRKGLDPYIDFATYLYGETYETLIRELERGDKSKRTIAKPAVLGCGFGLGAGGHFLDENDEKQYYGLLGYARSMGVELTLEQSKRCVGVWRSTYQSAVRYWYDLYGRAQFCMRKRRTPVEGTEWELDPPLLKMELPSGRKIHYLRPRLEPDPDRQNRMRLTYEGRLPKSKQWGRIGTHPAMVTENRVQAVARDLLADAAVRMEQSGIKVRLHTHDELGALFPEAEAEEGLRKMIRLMERLSPWAAGMPVRAAGYISPVYVKD